MSAGLSLGPLELVDSDVIWQTTLWLYEFAVTQ